MKTKQALKNLGVKPRRERGQNFVIDPSVIDTIVAFGNPSAGDNLVEIGAGLGALTVELARFPKLQVIEIEEKFCTELHKRFPTIRVIQDDVRKVDLAKLGENLVVFGNLPYIFSTEIVFYLIDCAQALKRAVLLLQREFAERLAAPPGGRSYGVLSVNAQLWADMRLGPIIYGDSFHPPTQVESRLVELVFLKAPRHDVGDMVWFKKVVDAAFFSRRRQIHNSLKASGCFSVEAITKALSESGITPDRRAETVSIEEFVVLAQKLQSQR